MKAWHHRKLATPPHLTYCIIPPDDATGCNTMPLTRRNAQPFGRN